MWTHAAPPASSGGPKVRWYDARFICGWPADCHTTKATRKYTDKASSIRTMRDAMNWSMFTADRATHLKVAVLGLTAVLLIAVVRIFVGG